MLNDDIEAVFGKQLAKLARNTDVGRFRDPRYAAVAQVLKDAEPISPDGAVRLARPFGQYLPFYLTRKSDAHASYEQMRFHDWHYFSCNSSAIQLWARMQSGLTFTERDCALIDTLKRDGIALSHITEFAPDESFQQMAADYEQRRHEYEQRIANTGTRSQHKPFISRISTAADLPLHDGLAWNALYLNPALARIAAAHLGLVPRLATIELWYSGPWDAAYTSSQKWHRDWDDRASVKVFLYLSAVTPENGPTEYVPGSHYGGRLQDLLRNRTDRIEDNEMRTEFADEKVISATGPAGTLVFFDGSGLHRGGRVAGGERKLSNMVYLSNATVSPPQPLSLRNDFTQPTDQFLREVIGL